MASSVDGASQASFGAMEMAELQAALHTLGYVDAGLAHREIPLNDTAARVPASLAIESLEAAERLLNEPLVGLRAGARVQPRGALVHLIMSAPRLRDSLRHVERFSRILINALRIELAPQHDMTHLVFAFDDPQLASHRQLLDYSLLATVKVLRGAMAGGLPLAAVHRRRAREAYDGDEHARLFECPVLFGQPNDSLVFLTRNLDAQPRVANPLVEAQMEKLAEALAGRVGVPATCRAQVEAAVRADLARGQRAERASVAARLAMSEATLTRRLAREAVTFKQIRESVLWELVDVLLANPALKLDSIALSVGFGDTAAFSKALKRRTGLAPRDARRRLQGQRS